MESKNKKSIASVVANSKKATAQVIKKVAKLQPIKIVANLVTSKSIVDKVKQPNKTYVIDGEFDLCGETFVLPKNVVLEFVDNGKITNGTLVGQNCVIRANKKVFYNVSVQGTWDCVGNVGWWADGNPIVHNEWGYVIPDLTDQSEDIQRALNSSFRELHFPPMCFYLGNTLELTKEKRIVLHGSDMKLNMGQTGVGKQNTAILFSDKDICLLRIAVNENYQNAVSIEGGSFDVSKCDNYTQNCIEVRADEEGQRIWGLTINTNIKGKYGSTSGVGININPAGNDAMTGNKAYVTFVRINSYICNFGVGVRSTSHNQDTTKTTTNWCSDVAIDGCISNCSVAVEAYNNSPAINATLQSGAFFDNKENGVALIKYYGHACGSVSSNIYDIRLQSGDKWSNEYAIEVSKNCVVSADGHFRAFCIACNKLGWPIVNGKIEL